ncbi:MAG TPA: hypothetical protein VE593_06325 [Nitrososphaeraceae archaeon]|nr:hypothetical protein [Nitrososphaeraceae archaeon]
MHTSNLKESIDKVVCINFHHTLTILTMSSSPNVKEEDKFTHNASTV